MNREPNGREASAGDRGELEPFLREAPGIVHGLQRNIERLDDEDRAGALAALSLLCHRLYGSASLYGLTDVSRVAAAMELAVAGVARVDAGDGGVLETARCTFTDAVGAVTAALDAAHTGDPGGTAPVSVELLDALDALAHTGGAADGRDLATRLGRLAKSNPDVLEYFEPEAREHLAGISTALNSLASWGGTQALDTAFRLLHTLKGAALMVECEPIGELAHAMEDLLELARDGHLSLQGEPLAALEDAHEVLSGMVAALGGRRLALSTPAREVRARLARITAAPKVEAPETKAPEIATGEVSDGEVSDGEASDVEANDDETDDETSPEPTGGARRQIRVQLDRIDDLGELVSEAMISRGRLEYLVHQLLEIERQCSVSRQRMADVAEAFERRHVGLQASRRSVDGGENGESDKGGSRNGGAVSADSARRREAVEVSLDGFSELELDRYNELDVLMRQIAEVSFDLGETQGSLSDLSRAMTIEIERSSRLLRKLRSSVARTRMLPLGRLMERFRPRAVRAAAEAGKQVRLEVSGGRVEVDTAIVEQLADPLLHLVSNALVHGIETVAERRAAGKPEQGTIALRATVRGSFVEIEVEDDGRGLDPTALRRRAVELGLWRGLEAPSRSDDEARELIFERGFSTAARLSDVSGRGVGMDVVRSTLHQLNGEIRIESLPGLGTRFTLRLPATRVVSTALKVRIGAEILALPTVNVRRVHEVDASESSPGDGGEHISLDGEALPLIRLGDRLGLSSDPPRSPLPLAVVQVPGGSLALAVDELLGIEVVVMRPLGDFLEGLVGFAGVSLNPDGSLVLVLDPAQLPALAPAMPRPAGPARDRAKGLASRPRVLLADDSISVRQVLARQLTATGYEVVTAQDGEQALAELRESRFDALITDIEMPHLNGFELLELVRRRPATRDLPTLVISTRSGDKHRELAERLGATGYLRKPIDREALLDALAVLLAPRPNPPDGTRVDDAGAGLEAS